MPHRPTGWKGGDWPAGSFERRLHSAQGLGEWPEQRVPIRPGHLCGWGLGTKGEVAWAWDVGVTFEGSPFDLGL